MRPSVRDRLDPDRRPLGSVGDGIGDQVAQRVVQLGRIAADDFGAGRDGDLDALRRSASAGTRSAATACDERAGVAVDDVERLLAGIEPRQPQQILDQPLHPLGVTR